MFPQHLMPNNDTHQDLYFHSNCNSNKNKQQHYPIIRVYLSSVARSLLADASLS